MKKILVMTLALAANLSSFAQENEDMGNEFSLKGRSLTIFRSETATAEVLKANAKATFWTLTGKDGLVLFCAKDAKTNETVDSLTWHNARVKKAVNKGDNTYMVHDTDSIYMKIIGLGSDIYAIQIYSQSVTYRTDIEEMTAQRYEKDPMSNRPGSLKWRSQHVGFTEWDNGTVGMGLLNPPHIFTGDRYGMSTCKVGLYDKSGKFLGMVEKWKTSPGERGTVLFFTGEGKFKEEGTGHKRTITPAWILQWMKETGGSVRFIPEVYGDYEFSVSAKLKE